MAEAAIMAEEMQPEKKVAFANRKYTNEEKRKLEEEEKNLPTQKRKHLRSVTLTCVGISKNKLKTLRKRLTN
jgi:aspartate oxidase